jgi:hypothetical protein
MHFIIERLNCLIKIPRTHVSIQDASLIRSKSLGVYDTQVELTAVRVSESDISCVSHQILVDS